MTIWQGEPDDDSSDDMPDRVMFVAIISVVLLTVLGLILNALPDLPAVTW